MTENLLRTTKHQIELQLAPDERLASYGPAGL
jgi:hypothetical protein